jgi:hypothetical protein
MDNKRSKKLGTPSLQTTSPVNPEETQTLPENYFLSQEINNMEKSGILTYR